VHKQKAETVQSPTVGYNPRSKLSIAEYFNIYFHCKMLLIV